MEQRTPSRHRAAASSLIRALRRDRGLTLAEISALVGCSVSHLAKIETGEEAGSPELRKRILDALLDDRREVSSCS